MSYDNSAFSQGKLKTRGLMFFVTVVLTSFSVVKSHSFPDSYTHPQPGRKILYVRFDALFIFLPLPNNQTNNCHLLIKLFADAHSSFVQNYRSLGLGGTTCFCEDIIQTSYQECLKLIGSHLYAIRDT